MIFKKRSDTVFDLFMKHRIETVYELYVVSLNCRLFKMGRIVAWDELSLFGIWDELSLGTNRRLGRVVALRSLDFPTPTKKGFSLRSCLVPYGVGSMGALQLGHQPADLRVHPQWISKGLQEDPLQTAPHSSGRPRHQPTTNSRQLNKQRQRPPLNRSSQDAELTHVTHYETTLL